MISLRKALGLKGGGIVSLVGAGGKTSLMFRIARELSEAGDSVLTTTTTKIKWPAQTESPHVVLADSIDEVLPKARTLLKEIRHITAVSHQIPPHPEKVKGFTPQAINSFWKTGMFNWILVEADGANRRPLKAPALHEPVIPDCSGWVIGLMGLIGVGKALDEKWVFRPELFAKLTGLKMGAPVTEEAAAASVKRKGGILRGTPHKARKIIFLNMADQPDTLKAGRRIAGLLQRGEQSPFSRIVIGKALGDEPVSEYYDLKQRRDYGKSLYEY